VTKRLIVNLCKYLLALGLLAWVVWVNWDPSQGQDPSKPPAQGLKQVWEKHFVQGQPIHYQFLALAAGLYAVSLIITMLRWYFLVRAQDLPFTVTAALRLGLLGLFYNTFLPGAVGGDIIKAAYLAREQSRRTVAVATVLMDRILALWALCWFVAILGGVFWACGLLEGPSLGPALVVVVSAAVVVVVSVAVWLLLGLLSNEAAERFAQRLSRIPKVGGSAGEFWRAVWMYRCRQGAVALTLVVSWVGQVGFVLTFYCCARALWDGADPGSLPGLAQHFLLVPIGLVISAVPGFPGGAGIGEAGFGGLYFLFAGPGAAPNGVLASLVQRVLTWVLGLAGLAISGFLKDEPRPAVVPAPEAPAAPAASGPEAVEAAGAA
jgi:uncharacterized protein (TIRG00374 family)